ANSTELELSQVTSRSAAALATAVIPHTEFLFLRFFRNGRRSSHRFSSVLVLLPERHSKLFQELARFIIRASGGNDCHVHSTNFVDLLVRNLRKDQLIPKSECVVTAAIEGSRRYPTEVTDARQNNASQPIQKFKHPIAAQSDGSADRHVLTKFEIRDRF